jgi:hypothetical protein
MEPVEQEASCGQLSFSALALTSVSAAARAVISSSLTTLKLLVLVPILPEPRANRSSLSVASCVSVMTSDEGIGLGAITSTTTCVGGNIWAGEADRAREVARR